MGKRVRFHNILQMTQKESLEEYLDSIFSPKVNKNTFAMISHSVLQQLPKWKANSLSKQEGVC